MGSGAMDLPTHILLYLLLVTAGQGLALSLVIGLKRPWHASTLFLSVFFLLFSLGSLEKSIEGIFYSALGGELPFPASMPLAYYPAIYLHLRFLTEPQERFSLGWLTLFAPSFVLDFLSFYAFGIEVNGVKQGWISVEVYPYFELLYLIVFSVQFVVYTRALFRMKERLVSDAPRVADPRLRWLRLLLPLLVVFWVSWLIVLLIGKGGAFGYFVSFLIHGALIVLVYGAGYRFLLKDSEVFRKYLIRRSKEVAGLGEEILERFKEAQLHRLPGLTLAVAAKRLQCSQKSLSRAAVVAGFRSFNDCVAELRIEDFKMEAQRAESAHLSLMGIAQAVGFSSKSSFHRSFKERCGQTPGEYLKSLEAKGSDSA